jgi:hypothetical protein
LVGVKLQRLSREIGVGLVDPEDLPALRMQGSVVYQIVDRHIGGMNGVSRRLRPARSVRVLSARQWRREKLLHTRCTPGCDPGTKAITPGMDVVAQRTAVADNGQKIVSQTRCRMGELEKEEGRR